MCSFVECGGTFLCCRAECRHAADACAAAVGDCGVVHCAVLHENAAQFGAFSAFNAV